MMEILDKVSLFVHLVDVVGGVAVIWLPGAVGEGLV
jgi:hypothetical protein